MKFSRIFFFLFILSLFLISACSNPEKEKEVHFQKAIEYIDQENNKAAIIELRNAVALDGKFSIAHYQLALLYIKEKNPDQAFKSFHRTVSLNPDNLDAGVKLAEFYLISRKKEESRKYVEQVLSKQPDNDDGLALLANLELIDGNFDTANETVNKALENNPKSARLYNIKGRIHAGLKQMDKAEEMFKKSVEYGADNYANYRTLLLFYQRTNKSSQMNTLLAEMTNRFPDNPQPHVILSSLHQGRKEFDQAEKELKLAIDSQPDNIQLHLILLEFYKKQRRFKTAESFLEQTITKIPDSLDLTIALADLRFEMQKFDQAKSALESTLKENELHGGANLLKAKFLLKERKNRDAIAVLSPLINDYPRWAEPSFQLARAHIDLGEVAMAQKAIEQALQNAPASSKYHTFLAQLYLLQSDGNNAGKEASIAIRLNSKNFRAAIILTKALIQVKKYTEAITILKKMLEQAPEHLELLGNLGLAYIGMKDHDNSIKTFTKLMSISPGNSKALGILASLTAGKDPGKEIELINNFIEQAPQSAGHYLLLGSYYLRLKSTDKALSAFRKAQELDPTNPGSYLAVGRLMAGQGETEAAIKEYRQLLKTSPDSVSAHMGLATLLDSQGKTKEATTSYQHILKIKPDFAPAANNLAWLLANSEDPDLGEALRLSMLAKKVLPDNPNITDTLGWIHFKRKSYSLAKTQFELALATDPENSSILFHLALVQSQEQEKQKAIEGLKKALASSDSFQERKEAEDMLAQLQKQNQ